MVKSIKIGYNEKENIIMKEFKYTITDPEGIHARPAGELVKAAKQFTSTIKLAKDGKSGDCKKIYLFFYILLENS